MKNKAVFLDRDGTVIEDRGYVHSIEEFQPMENIVHGLKRLLELEYMLVLVTNQSGVARNIFSESHLKQFHKFMTDYFNSYGIYFSGIYYCPHHPQAILSEYRMKCECRKPKPGLIKKAVHELEIDPSVSFTIGDSLRDITAGNQAGTKTILLSMEDNKDFSGLERPDYIAKNFKDAVLFIEENSLQ